MIWYDHMFLGTDCQTNYRVLKSRITRRRPHIGVYLITLPTKSGEVLEVIPSAVLMQEAYPADDLTIIGMASTHKEAVKMASDIVTDSIKKRGDADIEAYLREYRGNRRKNTT